MITEQQIIPMLLESCPSFKPVYDALDDHEKALNYLVAGSFAIHLLNLYKQNQIGEFEKVAEMIENLHLQGDKYVKEYATIGILEGIQNCWEGRPGEERVSPEKFVAFLKPESLKWWNSLNKFWAKKIPYVGYDLKE